MEREMGKVRQSPTEEGLRVPLLLDRGTPMLPVSQLAGTLVGELDPWALYWQGKVIKKKESFHGAFEMAQRIKVFDSMPDYPRSPESQ